MRHRITFALVVVLFLAVFATFYVNHPRPFTPAEVQAQSSFCDQAVAVTAPGAASTIVVTSVGNQTVYVCGLLLTGDTAATAVQLMSNSTALTGVMLTPANGPLSYGNGGAIVVRGIANGNLAVSAAVGKATGVITFGQH